MKVLGLFAGLLALQPGAADLHPTGPWQVTEQEIGCQVTRAFAGDADIEFGFETTLTTSGTAIIMGGPKALLPDGPGSIRVAAARGQGIDLHYGAFSTPDPKARMIRMFPDRAALGAIGAAETLEIGDAPIRLPMKGAGPALKALGDCTEGLLTGWGVDPKPWREGKLPGYSGSPQSWFTQENTRKLLPSGFTVGGVVLLVTTTPEGAPGSCRAVRSSDPRLDAPMCKLAMERTKFRAPIDGDGKPMASYAVLPVRLSR